MVNPSICAPCRMRKVRCDSGRPECGQCLQARRMFKCTYDAPTSKPTRDNLRKGEACMPCRRKKKKCDAAQPICDRCSAAGIGQECFYKERLPRDPPTLKDTTAVSLDIPQVPSHTPSTAQTPSPPSSGSGHQYTFPVTIAVPQFPVNASGSSSVSPTSSVDVDQANAQIPDPSLDDLNTSFRLTFLAHREQFGIYLPFGKHQAIILGDMSGACVHPFFIHFAHAIGCYLYQAHRGDFCLQEIQATHLELMYQALHQMKEEDDPFIYAQAHQYLVLNDMVGQKTSTAAVYYEQAVNIVERHGLHILKDPGCMISDETHLEASEVLEKAVFLSTILHLGVVLGIVNTKKHPLCYAIEEEFRYRFPKVFPFLFQVSPSILRVKSVLLVREASKTVDSAVKPGVEVRGLVSGCIRQISALTSHVDGITELLTKLLDKDHASAVSLQVSLVGSLTALAETLDLMSRISPEPLATDYRRRCIAPIMRAIEIAHGLGREDFAVVGMFIVISLKRLSTLLTSTISRLHRAPIEGVDIDSLDFGASILAEAKESVRIAFQPAATNPDSLASSLSKLLI